MAWCLFNVLHANGCTELFNVFDAHIIYFILAGSLYQYFDGEIARVRYCFDSRRERALGVEIEVDLLNEVGVSLQVQPDFVYWVKVFEFDGDFFAIDWPFLEIIPGDEEGDDGGGDEVVVL